MAIDRGPWNALVDDDGSNLVGSVWNKAAIKTVILDPVDAAIVPAVVTSWPMTDLSGAGLGSLGTLYYVKQGNVLIITGQIIYPATSNGASAQFSLPFPSGGYHAGLYQSYGGIAFRFWIAPSSNACSILDAVSGAARSNASVASSNTVIHGMYLL